MQKKVILAIILCTLAAFFLGMRVQSALHPATTTYVPTSESDMAKGALITFLDSLHEKDYVKAASTYGGDYSQLHDWNPNVSPNDTQILWKYGCEQNGLNCLEIRNVALAVQPDPHTFIFNVWFSNADKITEFKGPNGTSMFLFTVIKTNEGNYLVTTMPVYTP